MAFSYGRPTKLCGNVKNFLRAVKVIMRKFKAILLFVLVGVMIFLTSCESSDIPAGTAADKAEISEIRSGFSGSVERLQNKSYDNLAFANTEFSFPNELDSVCELTLSPLKGKSVDEIYEFFCGAVDILTDNKYTDEEKKYEIRFVDAKDDTDGTQLANDDEKPYPYNCPDIDEYKNGFETDYPWPTMENNDYSIDMMFGVLRSFDDGALMEYDGKTDALRQMYFMIGAAGHNVVFYTEDLTCTDKYKLIDGEISIADAAAFAQDYLDSLNLTPYEGNIPKPQIVAVNVVDIGKGCFGYNFVVAYSYKGAYLNCSDRKGNDMGTVLVENDYDKRSYSDSTGSMDMIRTNEIHRFFDIAYGVYITDGEPHTSIITLEAAADTVSEFFSGHMSFSVESVSMVWLPVKNSDEMARQAYPCWKFKMNSNKEIYHTFVNMITGEVYLYIQAV